MDRRTFLGVIGAGVGSTRLLDGPTRPRQVVRHELRRMEDVSGAGLTLTARETVAEIGPGRSVAWTLNEGLPAPTIRLVRGESARITLENQLSERTILHWHGLNVPEEADGHPRLAIAPGARYEYDFPVIDRAGTYWYHPHTHGRTAPQTYMGMAGLLIVTDEEEESLPLPSGEYELPLILQDKRLGEASALSYSPSMGPDLMLGHLGDTPFGNGVANPTTNVKRATYRLRILNASNARIFDLGLSNGAAMTLVGADGGLLESPTSVDRLMLGTGERADLLVDFSAHAAGDRVILRSFPFTVPGMMMGMGGGMGRGRGMAGMGGVAQGGEMELLEFVVQDSPAEPPPVLPERISRILRPEIGTDVTRRTFQFDSMMMNHTINGRSFEMERVDERVPLGRTEVWTLVNESGVPHPVHIHVGQFTVLSRNGGRNRVMPWERGLKDTVLLWPGERVDVAVRFDDYAGLFLLHCHNLEHEDRGMMLNFAVER